MISRDASESKSPLKVLSDKKATPSKPGNTAVSNATFQAQSSKTTPFSLSKSNADAFPPMSTRSPKPLSQSLNRNDSAAPSLSNPTTTPVKASGVDVDYKSALTKFFQVNSPTKVADVDATLQKYKVRKLNE